MRKGILLNGLVLALLAAGCAGISFLSFPAEGQTIEQGWTQEGSLQFDQDLNVTEAGTFRLNGRDSLTLLPSTQAAVHFDEENKELSVNLVKGGVIFSTLADDFTVSVLTPFARVDSQHSSAVVLLGEDAQELNVYAVNHPSLVTFLGTKGELNALNVPNQYRMKVPASKVTDLLSRLRLTKLTKEFPVFEIKEGDLETSVTELLSATQSAYDDSSVAFLNQLQDRSDFGPALTGFGGAVHEGYTSFRDALTVLPTAEEHLQEIRKDEALNFAMTNYLYGDAGVGKVWLDQWTAAAQDTEEVQTLYSSMFFVLPGDELYPVKAAAAQILYPQEDPLSSLRRQYAQIESLLERASQVDAEQAYQDYQTQFEAALDAGSFDDISTLADVSREYTLLELMLRGNAVFYTADSTQLLSDLEEKILALAGSSQDLDEERQAFVQSKLRFLDKLFSFVEDKKVSVEEGTDLANELIFEANTYLNSISTQVAVTSYFKTQLEKDQLSVAFMNSPEFYTYPSFEEGLLAYQAKQADLTELNSYIQNIRAGEGEVATMSLEEAKAQVEKDLITHAIQYSEVVSLGDSSYRLFEVKGARTGGYAFETKYDRETQILYDVKVEDVRFSTGLKLEDANEVIKEAMANQEVPEDEEDGVQGSNISASSPSLTESVALEVVKSQFEAVGLKADNFVFTVVDLDENTFSFEGAMLAVSVPVSGSYDADSQKVSEIVWQWSGTPQTLADTDLASFEAALQGAYLAATAGQ